MQETRLDFLVNACKGTLIGNIENTVKDVKIDSREAGTNDMFVCVVGEINNGHDYVEGAFGNGCRVYLMSDEDLARAFSNLHDSVSVILVKDTIKAFEQMAQAYIAQFNPIKLAVTGSVGKTTTRTLTAEIVAKKFNTASTKKNLNTNLGTCLTCFSADESTKVIVFEMGMDGRGQIKEIADFIRPNIAIITNIGVSHMEKLGSRDEIANAKLEIVSNFNEDCTLIVNSKSDYLTSEDEIRERAENKSNFKIVFCDGPESVSSDGIDGVSFVFKNEEYKLKLIGEHNAMDACLAICAGKVLGVSYECMYKALQETQSNEKRLKAEDLNGITLLDDSYNASPDSMKAAISALASVKGKRKIAVLADMYELGDAEEDGHFEVGYAAAENKIDYLIAVGENSGIYSEGVSSYINSETFVIEMGTIDDALELLLNLSKEGDVILVKGSNSTGISEVAKGFREAKK